MAVAQLALFDTAIGRCGIAWRESAVIAVQIPEASDELTTSRLRSKIPLAEVAEPTGVARDAVARITALLNGELADLDVIPIDVGAAGAFHRAVWDVTRQIGQGDVLTYGEVARRIGEPGAAQAVGQALGANPIPIIIPCHRVVGANHSLVGFSANGGIETKRRMLLIEGSTAVTPSLFDDIG